MAVVLFGLAAGVAVMAVRAVARGDVNMGGGGGGPIRRVPRSSQPLYFWISIGFHGVVTIFFLSFGLVFSGHAPSWLLRLMLDR